MQLYIDESGDYAFPRDGSFDAYVLAGLICPESELEAIEQFVRGCCGKWGCRELHASELAPEQTAQVARFIADRPLAAAVYVTDTEITDTALIFDFRLRQAEALAKSKDRWQAAGGDSELMAAQLDQLIGQTGLPQEVLHAEFIQQDQIPRLLHRCVQRSLDRYAGDEWSECFAHFDFVIDGKLPNRLSPGEEYARQIYKPALGSVQNFILELPPKWKSRPDHTFWSVDDETGEHTSLDLLFAEGLVSAESHEHPGLQLADIIANTVRRAVLRGPGSSTWDSYNLLRPTMATREGECFTIYRLKGGTRDADPDRYNPLMPAWASPLAA